MVESDRDLEATYGPPAPFSEHKRGDHITYTSAEGPHGAGIIVWCQAPSGNIPIKYAVAPDDGGFLDFVVPADVIAGTQEEQGQ